MTLATPFTGGERFVMLLVFPSDRLGDFNRGMSYRRTVTWAAEPRVGRLGTRGSATISRAGMNGDRGASSGGRMRTVQRRGGASSGCPRHEMGTRIGMLLAWRRRRKRDTVSSTAFSSAAPRTFRRFHNDLGVKDRLPTAMRASRGRGSLFSPFVLFLYFLLPLFYSSTFAFHGSSCVFCFFFHTSDHLSLSLSLLFSFFFSFFLHFFSLLPSNTFSFSFDDLCFRCFSFELHGPHSLFCKCLFFFSPQPLTLLLPRRFLSFHLFSNGPLLPLQLFFSFSSARFHHLLHHNSFVLFFFQFLSATMTTVTSSIPFRVRSSFTTGGDVNWTRSRGRS